MVLKGPDTSWSQRYSLSESQWKEAGLTAEEAAFQGSWSWTWRGMEISADRTFQYWALAWRDDHLENEVVSSGTWSVQGGKIRLEHREIHGRPQSSPRATEHTLAEFGH